MIRCTFSFRNEILSKWISNISPWRCRQFFTMYAALVNSSNYVTKRQSLKLLGEILLDRANFNVMTRYIANEANLKLIMTLLKDKSKNIQFEAFHVFKVCIFLLAFLVIRQELITSMVGRKVFVANPKKPAQVETILRRNKDKLLSFLKNFHNDKEDEQFSVRFAFKLTARQSGLVTSGVG